MKNVWILAQGDTSEAPSRIVSEPMTDEGKAVTVVPDSNAPRTSTNTRRTPGYFNLVLIALMFVVMYLLLFRGPQKKRQQHKQMVQTLDKNDRVRTIGGIIGTIVDVKGDEITLKIDESNNTKIKIASSAIGKNLSKEKS